MVRVVIAPAWAPPPLVAPGCSRALVTGPTVTEMAARDTLAFRGRSRERQALDHLLDRVRGGESAVLVIRGEAGIGKTALLHYCARQAAGCRVAQIAGVESELELPFAALHQLCAPMLGDLAALPEPQQRGIAGRLRPGGRERPGSVPGRSGGAEPAGRGRRRAAAGVPGRRRPVARRRRPPRCWGSSADACWPSPSCCCSRSGRPADERLFPGLPDARRSTASPTRTRGRCSPPPSPGHLDEQVRDRLVAETRGNPLALLELVRRDERGRAGRRLRRAARGHRCPVISRTTTCGGCGRCRSRPSG